MADLQNNDFLRIARERYQRAESEEAEIRQLADKDLDFVAGEQWDPKVKQDRIDNGRPALTFNKLPAFVQQVSNEARQNKATIKFSPKEDGDQDEAKINEGLARHIQYDSDAEVAYETAIDQSASGSFGYFRLTTEYCEGEGYDLELKVGPILDPFTVYGILIPSCYRRKPMFAFLAQRFSREEYEAQYPDSRLITSWGFDSDFVRGAGSWVSETDVMVAEYWRVESEKRKKVLLRDGRDLDWSDQVSKEVLPENIKHTRIQSRDVVKSCLINGVEILPDSETTWPGSAIPIFAVLGRLQIKKGKVRLFSLIRHALDPQMLVNYGKTRIAETLGQSPVSPVIGVEGQFEGHENEWATANTVPRAYLEYKSVDVDGKPAPRPERQTYEPPIAALSEFVAQEVQDIKESTSIFDPTLGAESNEKSGIAIQRRLRQSALSNMHFLDNLNRAYKEAGRQIAELIPKIYDTARQIRILGEDEQPRVVMVNQQWTDPKTGKPVHYKLTETSKYDIVVSVGPGYSTKRQETAELTGEIIKAAPEMMGIIGDIHWRNSDAAGQDELAERFKKWISMTTPGLIEDEKQQQIPPQAQQQMVQMSQMIDALTERLNVLTEELKTKKLELDSKERMHAADTDVAVLKIKTDAEVQMAKLGSSEAIAALKADIDYLKTQLSMQHAEAVEAARMGHESEESERERMYGAGMEGARMDHESREADTDRMIRVVEAQATREHASSESEADRQAAEKAAKNEPEKKAA